MSVKTIYLDNAATSWPKPEPVYEAADRALRELGGNPGRSGHRMAVEAGRAIGETRLLLARLFGASDPERFVFTANATEAINLALKGLLAPGDRAVTSSMEHNSVARPLRALEARGVEVEKLAASPERGLDPALLDAALAARPAKLVVLAHASNVTGAVNPLRELGAVCRARGALFLVDAAQTAGSLPIDIAGDRIDLLAFPGHKGLLGPQGTGGLYIAPGAEPEPLAEGGTGTDSRSLEQPRACPERYESGTRNTPGIAALGAALRYILDRGLGSIEAAESLLLARLVEGLSRIEGVRLFGPPPGARRAGAVSILVRGFDPAEAAAVLDREFGIAVRAGLHCAPDAHATMGTLDGGTVRISPGLFTTGEEIELCLEALAQIAAAGGGGR
jgi:cysteine desulfurase family protein